VGGKRVSGRYKRYWRVKRAGTTKSSGFHHDNANRRHYLLIRGKDVESKLQYSTISSAFISTCLPIQNSTCKAQSFSSCKHEISCELKSVVEIVK
jgi:hypothetical protein